MPNSTPRIVPLDAPNSLKDQAYRRIKDAILNLELRPGEPLVESDLADRLGISKTPVRDALTELKREGLVTKIPYSGTCVSEITEGDISEIIEIRSVLEGLAARLATPLLTDSELDNLEELITLELNCIAGGEVDLASQLNGQFHHIIIHKVPNQRLVLILENVEDQMQRVRTLSSHLKGRLRKSAEEHSAVLAALCARDADQAEHMIRIHMLSVLQDLSGEGAREVVAAGRRIIAQPLPSI